MSLLNENIDIKIKEVQFISWDTLSVDVAARPYHALAFRLNGKAEFSHLEERAKTNAGDVFYMPANYDYQATYEDKNEILVVHFESALVAPMENYVLNNTHIISSLFHKALDIWNKKTEGYYYRTLSAVGEILENLSIQQTPILRGETMLAFENAFRYMESNFTDSNFSIDKMVSKSFMSNTYFRKLFFVRFGVNPVKYLTAKRLTYAEKLLSTGKYSVKEAAEMSGFGDAKYFSRVVKKEYGVPPSKLYRHITE